MVVSFPRPTPGLREAAEATGGLSVTVPDASPSRVGVFRALSDALLLALRRFGSAPGRLPARLEDKEHVSDGGGRAARGTFLLDGAGRATLAVLYAARSDVGYVKLRPPGGQMQPVYTHFDTTNHLQYARLQPVVSGVGRTAANETQSRV